MTHGIGPFTAYEARHGHARGIDWEAFGHWLVGVVGYVVLGIVIGIALFVVAGCSFQSDEMKQRVPAGSSRVVTDEDGNKYTLRYYSNDLYQVTPLPKVSK